jgi:hypothetical protein
MVKKWHAMSPKPTGCDWLQERLAGGISHLVWVRASIAAAGLLRAYGVGACQRYQLSEVDRRGS